jgi:lipopolysaccharide export system protein LptA
MSRARIASPGLAVALVVFGASLTLGAGLAVAQPTKQNEPSPMAKGLTANSGQPVRIESTSLEVRDKSRMATFTGNVKVTQGDSTVQCKVLVVFYEDNSAPAPATKSGPAIASPGGGKQQIKRMEAKGDVIITQKDQTATGENGLFDVKANTLTLTGNVVLTQGTSVLNGDRMVVNLTTGVTHVDSSGKGPVRALFTPGQNETKSGPQPASPPPSPARPKSSGPMRLN